MMMERFDGPELSQDIMKLVIDKSQDDYEENKKLVYVATVRSNLTLEWSAIHAPRGMILSINPVLKFSNPHSFPPSLLKLLGYTTTVLESTIYFIGGYLYENDAVHSDQVFAYNLTADTWIPESPPMKEARPLPTVVTFNRNIYVFGFYTYSVDDDKSLTNDRWAEVYSADSRVWTYLKSHHPPELVDRNKHLWIASHAVHESRRMVVFWVPCAGVYMFSFDSQLWTCLDQPISDGPRWSTTAAWVQDYLFWHYFGSIYVYDFNDQKTMLLYTMPDASQFGEPVGLDGYPYPSFLVAVGKKLYLFWYRPTNFIECRIFTIQCSRDSRILDLSLADSQSFHTEGYQIQTVFAMAAMEKMEFEPIMQPWSFFRVGQRIRP